MLLHIRVNKISQVSEQQILALELYELAQLKKKEETKMCQVRNCGIEFLYILYTYNKTVVFRSPRPTLCSKKLKKKKILSQHL